MHRPRLAVGTAQHFEWLQGVVKSTIVLNLLDGVFTLAWVQAGLAEEANALLADLVTDQAVAFMLVKLALVSLGAVYLWRIRTRPLAVVAIFGSFLLYYLIVLYHLQYTSALFL